jgi:hypothetical protein
MRSAARDAFLRDLLRHFAGNGTAGLQEMMRTGTPALAANAAALLLHGHDFGAWRARPRDLKLARTLAGKSKSIAKLKHEAKPMQPLKWSDLGPTDIKPAARLQPGSPDFLASLKRVLEIHHRMNATFRNPGATPHMQIAAMQEWVAVLDANGMGNFVPPDIRQGLAAITLRHRKETAK